MKYAPAWIIGLSFSPLVLVHLRNLGMDERYQHFPLVLGAVGVLLWTRWAQRGEERIRFTVAVSLALLLAAILCGTGAAVLSSPWLAFVAACLVFVMFLLDLQGLSAFRFMPVALLLLLMLPLPMNMDDALVIQLQDVSSRWASQLLDFFGVQHMLSGHIIEVPGAKFMVEEACSGVRSLFAMIALAAIFVVYERRSIVHSILLICSSLFWSGAMNVVRIVAVVLSQLWLGIDLARGWKHDSLGLVVFVLAMVMLFCTDRLLLFFIGSDLARRIRAKAARGASQADVGGRRTADGERRTGNGERGWRIATSWLVAIVILVLVGVPSTLVAGIELWQYRQDDSRLTAVLLRQDALPIHIGEWEQVSFQQGTQTTDPTHGAQWAAWRYRKAGVTALVSLDFPFHSWHNLTVCYEGAGWTVASWQLRNTSDGGASQHADIVRFTIEKPNAEGGVVFFNLFNTRGKMLPAPSNKDPAFADWITGLKLRMARQTNQLGLGHANYQLQVMAAGTPDELKRAENDLELLFSEGYTTLAGKLVAGR